MHFQVLRYFREAEGITKSSNHLPHWEQEGACYFLTFHLGDSLPHHLLKQWQSERSAWQACHPHPWSESVEMEYHQRFSAAQDRWLDAGYGSCCLKASAAEVVENSLRYFDQDRYALHAFVVMPNHVHVLVSLNPLVHLADVIKSWKSYSARQINLLLQREGPLWQKDYFDRIIRDEVHFSRVVNYIRKNPEKGYVPSAPLYFASWLDEG